jgi:hypothetical protein
MNSTTAVQGTTWCTPSSSSHSMPRSVSLASSGTSIWPPLTSLMFAMAVILVALDSGRFSPGSQRCARGALRRRSPGPGAGGGEPRSRRPRRLAFLFPGGSVDGVISASAGPPCTTSAPFTPVCRVRSASGRGFRRGGSLGSCPSGHAPGRASYAPRQSANRSRLLPGTESVSRGILQ